MEGFIARSHSAHFVSLDRANQAAAGSGHGPGHRTHGHNTLLLPAQATSLGGCWITSLRGHPQKSGEAHTRPKKWLKCPKKQLVKIVNASCTLDPGELSGLAGEE